MVNGRPSGRRGFALGILILMLIVVFWVTSSFLVNQIFQGSPGREESTVYAKPYLLTYFNTAVFSFYLIPASRILGSGYALAARFCGRVIHILGPTKLPPSSPPMEEDGEPLIGQHEVQAKAMMTTKETAWLSAEFCVQWFMANWTANASLGYTNVPSSTILQSCAGFFTLLFGSYFGIEKVTWTKFVALVICLGGICLVSWEDASPTDDEHDPMLRLLGDALALGSAAFYGMYTTLLKVRMGDDDSHLSLPLFFGFVGLFNFLALWPFILLLHYTGVERLELPPSAAVVWEMLANATVTFISDYIWVIAMLLTTPLTVTVGLSLTIPLAMLANMVIRQQFASGWYWLGATFVFSGFLVASNAGRKERRDEVITSGPL